MSRSTLDLGLLGLRVGVGATLFAHGAQKLLGWFGGGGLSATAAGFEGMGFRPGRRNALAAGLGEAGGALLVAGAGTPFAAAAAAGTMIGAASVHRPNGFFNTQGGVEYPAVLGLTTAALALTGPGRYSVDHLLGHRLNRNWQATLALSAAVGGGAYVVARRQKAVAAAAAEAAATGTEPGTASA
ncbi:DoxX family membrane protein [Kineosporia sp. J2-2]|uniref:DoxX family membrane protein n=1 Tax=Kineosporia corallincola TaxID=2835133 RepID=A0ABS5TMW5_9ACTN|nr:DoxX family membrane protein [Kineosporia corallincola]MBT0772425.1 DoxX family membrane protein [Kineosporia corallincola]